MRTTVKTLVFALPMILCTSTAAFSDTDKKGFHVRLPGAEEGNNTTATDVHITFFGPVTSGSAPGWTTATTNGNTLNLSGGSLSPGNHLDLNATIQGSPAAGTPIITQVQFSHTVNGMDTNFLTPTPQQALGRNNINGFTNFERFDFSERCPFTYCEP